MTPKLNSIIKSTAIKIVAETEDCLFDSSKIKKAETVLQEFAATLEKELTPPIPEA
jgi:hypothetical protein